MRTFHGLYDAAGQAWEIVKAERKLGQESKLVLYYKNPRGYGYDRFSDANYLNPPIFRKIKKVYTLLSFIPFFDVFHFYRAQSFLGEFRDLLLLRRLNKKIIMHFFGSEVRRHDIARKYQYHYADDLGFNDAKEAEKSKRVEKIRMYADALIVPDYEVLEYVSGAEVVPLTYDADTISKIKTKTSTGNKIKILHAPSNRIIKGTDKIIEVVSRIKRDFFKKYDIDFKLIENVNHDQALDNYAEADIIIDQLRLGMYATLSIESMALGKPVVCYIRDDVAKNYPDCPVVNASFDNLYEKLKMLIEDKNKRFELGKKGIEYAKKHHHPTVIAKQFIKIYKNI